MKNNDDFFGTMFDFNGDGHTDITETYMAYRMMNDDDDSSAIQHSALCLSLSQTGYSCLHGISPQLLQRCWRCALHHGL